MKQKQMFFWNSLAFSMVQQVLAIWSVSSAFSKSSLYIWKSKVHVLLKLSLKDFENYLANMWNEWNCVVVWTFSTLSFFGIGVKTDLFQSCGHCCVFQICWHNECSTFTASSFRIWNSSTGIPSPPLALFAVMLPKAHLTSESRMSGSRWVSFKIFEDFKLFWLYALYIFLCIVQEI